MNQMLNIDKIEIFEWYDGIVLGLLCAGDSFFLVCLLAFNANTMQKKYLLALLSPEQMEQIKALFQESGVSSFNKLALSKIIAGSKSLYLTSTEPVEGKTASLTSLDSDQQVKLQELSFPLIDIAVTEKAISQWLVD